MTLLRHVGIVVNDLEKSLKFWKQLGFKVEVDSLEPSPFINFLLDVESEDLRTIKLSDQSGNNIPVLELLFFKKSKDAPAVTPNQIGLTHIALTVENFDSVRSIIETNGGQLVSIEPQVSPNGKVRVAYFRCLDKILLEIVEPLRA